MFFSTLKEITKRKYKVKETIELAKTLWLFAQKASPSNVFCSVFMLMQA